MAKRTLSHKDGTAWPESGMRSLDSFERLCLRLQVSIPALSTSFIMSQRLRLQLRILENGRTPLTLASAANTWNCKFLHGPGDDPRHREAFRLRLRLKYFDGSGQNISACAVTVRL